MIRDVAGQQVERGERTILRVKLDALLEPTGEVTATITEPVTPVDPETAPQEDFWRDTDLKVHKVRNGIPTTQDIPLGNICWIVKYSGRWCVIVPEC